RAKPTTTLCENCCGKKLSTMSPSMKNNATKPPTDSTENTAEVTESPTSFQLKQSCKKSCVCCFLRYSKPLSNVDARCANTTTAVADADCNSFVPTVAIKKTGLAEEQKLHSNVAVSLSQLLSAIHFAPMG